VSFRNLTPTFNPRRLAAIVGLMLIVLAGCANNPIDTSSPVAFKHGSGVFELQVPRVGSKSKIKLRPNHWQGMTR
jgi:hypothetical protein